MKIQSVRNRILKLGGTAEIKYQRRVSSDYPVLEGIINGYDIHMTGTVTTGEQEYYTVRAIRNREEYDMGADYNPGGFLFMHRVKDLDAVAHKWESGE